MELLIPGLLLVALMVWASTKIKKRAAEAFEAETIETSNYVLDKPEGFLHVLDSPEHEFEAYSKEAGEETRAHRATIEIDFLRDTDLRTSIGEVTDKVENYEVVDEGDGSNVILAEETANEIASKVHYKFIDTRDGVYRLRFSVMAKYSDDYESRMDETLRSFQTTT